MSQHRKIKDSTIYHIYEKLYNIYVNDHYDTIEDFVIDIKNLNYSKDSDVNIILDTLLRKVNEQSQAEYLCFNNINYHSSLLIMVSNDNFIYLIENPDKTFKDVFGSKNLFSITSHIVDMLGKDALKELTFKNE